MKLLLASVVLSVVSGCVDHEAEHLGETEAASTPIGGQGTMYNGTMYNGTMYNGTMYNGTMYNGTMYNNASYGGTTMPDAAVISAGTALVITVDNAGVTEQRSPDRICTWTGAFGRKQCTTVDLSTTPSPLAGTSFAASFTRPLDGAVINGTISIGTSTTDLGVVKRDTTLAMHPIIGGASGTVIASGAVDAYNNRCDNPNGCRVNSDLWLYTLKLWDPTTATYLDFCPGGAPATAMSGTWDTAGKFQPSTSTFTFACTTGTIEKCVRWGYRPWASAQTFCNQNSYCPVDSTLYPMADYHQACVRAAAADYCANGHSFTKNGTIVDIYDYNPSKYVWGMIPQTRGGLLTTANASGVIFEASFDKYGAVQIDHGRYQEIASADPTGTNTVDGQCPGSFEYGTNDITCPNYYLTGVCEYRQTADNWSNPSVKVDSTPACSHSELLVGKWLHRNCSQCTAKVAAYCNNPADSRGWDANCVAQAKSKLCSPTQRMATHDECTVGPALTSYDSGCTLAVCLENPKCCSTTGWSSTCVNAANSKCGFAKKNGTGSGLTGICMSQPALPPTE